ncbi:hypothetical protein LRS11_18460 [Pseudomonas sp. J452]|uniref:hypothetical protein n=1 Tax=Pseudomonas sp. J452 TaxID=2898441 RepID=UPI0021ADACCC|nr:hypothetical protein [Pseudomonas sp. J452]UUY07773.1 hypothetical protein LRS11_18460 [Pseudomonas sp. J452]
MRRCGTWQGNAIACVPRLAWRDFAQQRGSRTKREQTLTIAEEWRRLFGLPQFWHIQRLEDDTAYCEIRFPCALEGSGDVAACQRLMEYDRALLKKIGGQLVVLQSRADPQVRGGCQVAIRRIDDLRSDLIPARLLD